MAAGDHELARRLADAAGELLLQIRVGLEQGAEPDAVREEGDQRSSELLVARLHDGFPDDAVLSEEARGDGLWHLASRCWIVDPLDGTREFGERGHGDWAVHVALVVDGELAAGAVSLPALGLTYATDRPPVPPPPVPGSRPRIGISRSRPAAASQAVAEALDGELVPMGSAGAKAMAVVRGELDAYVHAGGQYVWDSAAPVAVALAAGLHASRADGSPPRYGGPSMWLPDLVICRPQLAGAVLAALADA